MTAVINDDTTVAPSRCKMEEVFASPFIELIGLAPKNPVVRGLILAQTRRLPGSDCETFEQIKAWVETTCDRPVRPLNATRVPAADGIRLTVEFSETEHGRASYSVARSGSSQFDLNAEELLDMVEAAIDAGDGLESVIQKIATLIDEDAWNRCDPSLDSYGEYDYDDHDSGDSDHSVVEFSRNQVRERLRAFLQEQHPELAEALP